MYFTYLSAFAASILLDRSLASPIRPHTVFLDSPQNTSTSQPGLAAKHSDHYPNDLTERGIWGTEVVGSGLITVAMECGPSYKHRRCPGDLCCSKNGWVPPEDIAVYIARTILDGVQPLLPLQKKFDAVLPLVVRSAQILYAVQQRAIVYVSICTEPDTTNIAKGAGAEYCKVPDNCQPDFGFCDSEVVPKGDNTSSIPRPRGSNVAYGEWITACTKPRTLALTFDDGPNNHTNKILNLLEEKKAFGTFFLSGNTNGDGEIDTTPEWVQTITHMQSKGHQIGSHTWSHINMNKVPSTMRKDDMWKNERALANVMSKFPTYMRPPYSECSEESGCLNDMKELGYHVVGFSVDTGDTEPQSTLESMQSSLERGIERVGPDGSLIVIQHEHTAHSAEFVEYALNRARLLDWKVVTVGECLGDPWANWLH